MVSQEAKILQDWYRKRKLTTISGIFLKCIFSFEYSAIVISALYYLKDAFPLSNDKLLYSLTLGFMYFTALLAAGITGRYVENTRNLRKIVIIALLLSVIGNVMYALPVSIWIPVIARGICGIADSIQPALAGELSRCYSQENLGKVLTIYYVLSAIIFAIAPCSLVLFAYVDFNIGNFVINQYNFIGIFQAVLNVVTLVFSFFTVFDLTKDPGYKLFLKETEIGYPKSVVVSTKESEIHQKESGGNDASVLVKSILNDGVLVILMSGSALLEYLNSQLETLIVFVAVYNFSWSLNRTGIATSIGMLVVSILSLLFQNKVNASRAFYYSFVLCFISGWISLCMVLFSINSTGNNEVMKTVLFEESLCSLASLSIGANAYGRWLQFSLVSPNYQSFVDSVRHIGAKAFCCLGFFTAAFVYDFNAIVLPILAFACFCHTFLLLIKRHDYFGTQKFTD